MEKLLTSKQLSELIQVNPKTIYQWIHIGFIPCYKFRKGVRFRIKDIEDWLKNRRRRGRNTFRLITSLN